MQQKIIMAVSYPEAVIRKQASVIRKGLSLIHIFVESLHMPPIGVVLLFIVILMILGCILDSTSILLLTTPLMCPIMADLGYDLVWFGLIMIIAIETGMITPPFGMNVDVYKRQVRDPTFPWRQISAGTGSWRTEGIPGNRFTASTKAVPSLQ